MINGNSFAKVVRTILLSPRLSNSEKRFAFSSVVSETGVMGTSAYAASKAGINGLIKSVALENAQKGITINNINLGYFI